MYQIHTFPIWHYEGAWFALTDILAATNKHVTDGAQDYRARHERGVWKFYMAPSRDAVNYDFTVAAYPRKALIPRGPGRKFRQGLSQAAVEHHHAQRRALDLLSGGQRTLGMPPVGE